MHGRWSLGGAMGDPTAVGRCRGGLLDGRWSGGGRPRVPTSPRPTHMRLPRATHVLPVEIHRQCES